MRVLSFSLYNLSYHSLSHSSIGSIIVCATSTNSSSSALSSCDTYLIRFITLTSSSLPLSLKTSIISKLPIKGAILSSLFTFIRAKWLIILLQWLLPQAQRYTYIIAVILSLSKVIPLCSYCIKKGLVYIAIAAPSSHQPSFYFKCTSLNI